MITSVRNPKVAQAIRLKKRALREHARRFLVEGSQAIGEALASDVPIEVLFSTSATSELTERARGVGATVLIVNDGVMGKLTSTVTPQGAVAVSPFIDVPLGALRQGSGMVAILHAVRDPGNAGTILRSADGAGADAVVFSSSSVDVYNPKTVRASAGSLFHLPVVRAPETPEAIAELRARGLKVYATSPYGDAAVYEVDLTAPTAFVFGNEAWGLPDEVARLADAVLCVPLSGKAESLNLAAAASLCMFEWDRQQREGRRVVLETLIAAAAHDIRSPLTAMKGFGYALAARWANMTDEHRTLMLKGIVYDTDRLDTIVRQLVDAARIVSGRLEVFPERVGVGQLVRELAESLRRDPDHPEIMWEGGDVVAFVDPDRLRTTIGAFIEAAVWWTREGPVHVRGETRERRLVIEVSRMGPDDAPLLDAEALFQPRPPGAGAGSKIGLFVARGVAEAQGGSATVEVGDRITFRLDIPEAERPV